MDKEEILDKTEEFARAYFADKETGHDWWHIYRVRNNAKYIYSVEETGDPFIIEMAALLHDIGDDKIDPLNEGSDLVRSFLSDLDMDIRVIDLIIYIMAHISFRDSFEGEYRRIPELEIVQDADRLDAIGAIGIARAFNYGGSRNNEVFNPDIKPRKYNSGKEYTKSDSSTINHFYEKLLLLKNMMNTETGKKLAEERHAYMEEFLEQFFREWDIEVESRRS